MLTTRRPSYGKDGLYHTGNSLYHPRSRVHSVQGCQLLSVGPLGPLEALDLLEQRVGPLEHSVYLPQLLVFYPSHRVQGGQRFLLGRRIIRLERQPDESSPPSSRSMKKNDRSKGYKTRKDKRFCSRKHGHKYYNEYIRPQKGSKDGSRL